MSKKELRKILRGMEQGQSIIIAGMERVKTNKGFYSPKGFKYLEKELIEEMQFRGKTEWEVIE
jgi:hypothetical protein